MTPWDSCNDGSNLQRSMLCQQFFLKVGFLADFSLIYPLFISTSCLCVLAPLDGNLCVHMSCGNVLHSCMC